MSTAHFTLIYGGPALTDGQMDIRELAPSLLGTSTLFEEANRILNNGKATVSVQVRGFKKGSLGVELIVTQAVVGHLNIVDVSALVVLIFGSRGVLDFFKWLRGEKPTTAAKLAGGDIQISVEGSKQITITNNVFHVAESPRVRKAITPVIEPLTKEGINSLKVTADEQLLVELGKEDVPAFTTLEVTTLLPKPINVVREKEMDASLQIVAPSFKRGAKWRLSDGRITSSYLIEDSDFLRKVDEGTEQFAKGDVLKVKLRTIPRTTKRGRIRDEQIIVKVFEHFRKNGPPSDPSVPQLPLGSRRRIRLPPTS